MKYLYYPGCTLESSAKEYNLSTHGLLDFLGHELVELEDWTCCGATAAEAASRLLSLALPARNLALAEAADETLDVLVPCSACYLNLKKVEEEIRHDARLLETINDILKDTGLSLKGSLHVRHLLDVIARDMDPAAIREKVVKKLTGLKIAPYYGCQCLRPYPIFDDPEEPCSMEPMIEASGAEVFDWTMGGKCCGASQMTTKPEVGKALVAAILREAQGAHAIVTVCPMCQMNLEAYQSEISRDVGDDLGITVLYLPQLLGLALGLPNDLIRLDLNLAVKKSFLSQARD